MFIQKTTKRYSFAVKQKARRDWETGKYTKTGLAKLYGVYPSTIVRWLEDGDKKELLTNERKVQQIDKVDRIKELEEDKRALESALGQAYLQIINLESTIRAIEREYGIDAKKNFGIR